MGFPILRWQSLFSDPELTHTTLTFPGSSYFVLSYKIIGVRTKYSMTKYPMWQNTRKYPICYPNAKINWVNIQHNIYVRYFIVNSNKWKTQNVDCYWVSIGRVKQKILKSLRARFVITCSFLLDIFYSTESINGWYQSNHFKREQEKIVMNDQFSSVQFNLFTSQSFYIKRSLNTFQQSYTHKIGLLLSFFLQSLWKQKV